MILATVNELPGKSFKYLGLVKGSVVHTKHIGRDIMAGFKSVIGGEIKAYTDILREARVVATNRMVEEAKELGANAVLGVRYECGSIMNTAVELIVYGTAVSLE